MEKVDHWIEGEDPTHTFGYYCGLEAINFPPAERLTNEDIKQVCKVAFRKMMFSWTKTEIVNCGTLNLFSTLVCIFKE